MGGRLGSVNRRGEGDSLERKGRGSGWRDGIAAEETGPGRRGQHGVDQSETGEPGRRGTSQSCEAEPARTGSKPMLPRKRFGRESRRGWAWMLS